MSPAYLRTRVNKCSFLSLFTFIPAQIFFPRIRFASKTTICDGTKPHRLYICITLYYTTHIFIWFKWKSNGVGLNASLHHQSTNTTCFSVKLQCENQSSLHFSVFISFPIPFPFSLATPSNSPHTIHSSRLKS